MLTQSRVGLSLLKNFQLSLIRQQHQHASDKFAYDGNPLETKTKLRRHVPNISYPDFEKQECIKWADWMMLRDVKKRYIHADYWQYRLNMKTIARNRALPSLVREIAWEERQATPRKSSLNHLTNRCALSSRSRGKFSRYRLSRILWRDCADHGMLSGYIRAKWG